MESLYKIDKIDGKGLGWIALQDIKCGTLICKEKFQFIVANEPGSDMSKNMLYEFGSFKSMSKYDQKGFLKLNNAFSDPKSLNDEMKKTYFDWKKVAESLAQSGWRQLLGWIFNVNLMLKIRGIFKTNFNENFEALDAICIKISRINHSCGPNAEYFLNRDSGEVEIRATSKILKGQEITISYFPSWKMETGAFIMMEKSDERQKFLSKEKGFLCSCELCLDEDIFDVEMIEKFQRLKEEVGELWSWIKVSDVSGTRKPDAF